MANGKDGLHESTSERAVRRSGRGSEQKRHSNYNYDEAVLKVQEWNEALKCEYEVGI